MSNIHDDAFKGTLTADLLNGYLSNDSSIVDSRGGPKSLTPLAAATSRGHLDVVRLLLENPIRRADPDALSIHNRTPLFFATSRSPAHDRGAIVRLLLDSGADVDLCFDDDGNNTPLMNAIFQLRDKEVVHQLVDCGASLTKNNAQGDTAVTLAKKCRMEADLQPRNERISNRAEIINALVAVVLLIFSYINKGFVKDIMDGVVKKLYGISGVLDQTIVDDMHPKPNPTKTVNGKSNTKRAKSKPNPEGLGGGSGTWAVQSESESESEDSTDETIPKDSPNRISVEELQADLTTYIKDTGLEKFFAPGDRFLQDLAKNAAALKDDPLGTPDNIKRLTCLSLYQPVIYCDDSGSMSQHGRYQSQQELVTRIAAIATKIVPDNLGVELCFINAKDSSHMSAVEINNAMASVQPNGGTQIGTNLRNKILKPLVYDVLANASKKLQRPLLVCAITDGCPYGENASLFQKNIVECTRELNKRDYEPNAVTFCISQIGDDKDAAAFLDGLRGDTEIQDVLYCTTDRLDKMYEELKGNENRLEAWLLKTLTSPIMNRNEA